MPKRNGSARQKRLFMQTKQIINQFRNANHKRISAAFSIMQQQLSIKLCPEIQLKRKKRFEAGEISNY
jgi:hypothetical protein